MQGQTLFYYEPHLTSPHLASPRLATEETKGLIVEVVGARVKMEKSRLWSFEASSCAVISLLYYCRQQAPAHETLPCTHMLVPCSWGIQLFQG